MEINSHNNDQWIDSRIGSLSPDWDADFARGQKMLGEKRKTLHHSWNWTMRAATVVGLCVVAAVLPQTRAIAKGLWDRLVLQRVEVVRVDLSRLPLRTRVQTDGLEAQVANLSEAEQRAGFRPYLPSLEVISGSPNLIVAGPVALQQTVHVGDLETALARAGITDVQVPAEWDGVTLKADIGPTVIASYPGNLLIVQGRPPELTVPAGFALERLVEAVFRSVGVPWRSARAMGREFAAHPAWFLDIPAGEPVEIQTVELRNGLALLIESPGGLTLVIRSTADRVYLVSSLNRELSRRIAADLP